MRFDGSIRLAQAADIEYLPAIERAAAQLYRPYLSQLQLTPAQLEERYGFSRHVRVVMQCQIPHPLTSPFKPT